MYAGKIPEELGKLTALVWLKLGGNKLIGESFPSRLLTWWSYNIQSYDDDAHNVYVKNRCCAA